MIKLLNSVIVIFTLLPISAFAEKEIIKPASTDAFSMMGALNMAMGLVVVIALILSLAWVLKKYARLPNNNLVEMKVLGGLSLGTREKAILIEVDNKRLLVGVTPGHIQTLCMLDETSLSTNESEFKSKLETAMDNQS